MPEQRARARGRLTNFALLVATSLLMALLLEGALRLFGYEKQFQYVNYLGREQVEGALPGLPYLYTSHASFTQTWPSNPRGYFEAGTNRISYRVNNYGFRGADFDLERGEAIRIAFLGDSFCWGNGVKENDIFTSLVEQRLNAGRGEEPPFEVYNFCLAGYGTAQEAALYDHVVRHFRPDMLVVSFFLNDVNLPTERLFGWGLQSGGDWMQGWRNRSRLVDLAVAPLNRAANHRQLLRQVQAAYEPGHPGYVSVGRGLRHLRHLTESEGVTTSMTLFPWLYRLDEDSYPFRAAHDAARALAESEGFAVLDLFPAFAGKNAEELWVYASDQHPNEVAHRIAAEEMSVFIARQIEEEGGTFQKRAAERREEPPPPAPPAGESWFRHLASLSSEQEGAEAPKPPNILFLLADDLGYGDLGAYGSTEIRTPHLDRLAAQGMRFTSFYSNGATCTPTRAGLLTGRYPQRFGFRKGLRADSERGIAADVSTLPRRLRQVGYTTFHVGKWHLGHAQEAFRPPAKGYDSFFGFLHAWRLPKTYRDPKLLWNEGEVRPHRGHLTDLLTAEAAAFLRRQAGPGPPFFLSLWYFAPHTPHEPPARWAEQYPDTSTGRYRALVSALDENVGQLLEALEEAGLAGETLVIFASDNGGVGAPWLERESNGPFRGLKNTLLEGGIRVPLIVRWPGQVAAGSERDELVVGFDWVPTLLELGGARSDDMAIDGQSLLPLLTGEASFAREEVVFWEDFDRQTLVHRFVARRGPWKLLDDSKTVALYDLATDPGESDDVSAQRPEIVEELTDAYRSWRLRSSEIPLSAEAASILSQPLLDPHDGSFSFLTRACAPEESLDSPLARKGKSWILELRDGKPRLEAGGVSLTSSNSALRPGSCAHLAFTFLHPGKRFAQEKGRLSLYVDGRLEATNTEAEPLTTDDGTLVLGASASWADTRIFSAALTASEVADLGGNSPGTQTP